MKNKVQKSSGLKLIFSGAIISLFLLTTACQDNSNPNAAAVGNSTTKITTVKMQGVTSGGGGYSQDPTNLILEVAKNELADAVQASPDIIFKEFPEDFNKQKITEIIRNVEFKPMERRERDGSYLKMDYDEKTKTLIATYDFYVIYNASSVLLIEESEMNKMVYNMQNDILHELSHLLGVGTNRETNLTSQIFAFHFFLKIRDNGYLCESKDLKLLFNPYTKSMVVSKKSANEQNKADFEYLVEDGIFSNFEETLKNEPQESNNQDYYKYIFASDLMNKLRNKLFEIDDSSSNESLQDLFSSTFPQAMGYAVFNTFDPALSSYSTKSSNNMSSSYATLDGKNIKFDIGMQTTLAFSNNYSQALLKHATNYEFAKGTSDADMVYTNKNIPPVNMETEFQTCQASQAKVFPLQLILKNQVSDIKDPKINIIDEGMDF